MRLSDIQWSMALSEVANPEGKLCCDPVGVKTITRSKKAQAWLRDHAYGGTGCNNRADEEGYWLSLRDSYPDKLLAGCGVVERWPATDPTFGKVVG